MRPVAVSFQIPASAYRERSWRLETTEDMSSSPESKLFSGTDADKERIDYIK